MLLSDGLSQAQFMPLWEEAMTHAPDHHERARLVLELGRLSVREQGRAGPLLIALCTDRDPPLDVVALRDVPSTTGDALARAAVQHRLAELGASEVHILSMLRSATAQGRESFLLTAWCETADGEEACWMQAIRWVGHGLDQASPLAAPDPSATEMSRRLKGLLTTRH